MSKGLAGKCQEVKFTTWNESDIFAPCYWHVSVLAATSKANFNLFHGAVATQELLLLFSKGGTGFDQVDGFDTCCQWLEIANSLSPLVSFSMTL